MSGTASAGERVFAQALSRMRAGRLRLETASAQRWFGGDDSLQATLRVHDPRFFARALEGDIGLGESFMDGDWSSPDLVSLVRLMLRNQQVLGGSTPPWVRWVVAAVGRWRRDNSRAGSRRHIAHHYDLGNQFFRLFLDANLLYSCAYYQSPQDSLEAAQVQKLDLICRKLRLGPQDHVLEIGTGWGGFAAWAATRYGCRVTTTTISRQQHDYAANRFAALGAAGERIDLRLEDYRDLRGVFSRIVSIEMFEAVGYRHYDAFFGACQKLLAPDGLMLLQTITIDDRRFRAYRRSPDWLEKYIFPGSELASVAAMIASINRTGRLSMLGLEDIGSHYALTLREWRRRFHARLDEARTLGCDARFLRMWDLYLAYCEGAFAERSIGNVQMVLAGPDAVLPVPGVAPEALAGAAVSVAS